jgi:hypothetical protein
LIQDPACTLASTIIDNSDFFAATSDDLQSMCPADDNADLDFECVGGLADVANNGLIPQECNSNEYYPDNDSLITAIADANTTLLNGMIEFACNPCYEELRAVVFSCQDDIEGDECLSSASCECLLKFRKNVQEADIPRIKRLVLMKWRETIITVTTSAAKKCGIELPFRDGGGSPNDGGEGQEGIGAPAEGVDKNDPSSAVSYNLYSATATALSVLSPLLLVL